MKERKKRVKQERSKKELKRLKFLERKKRKKNRRLKRTLLGEQPKSQSRTGDSSEDEGGEMNTKDDEVTLRNNKAQAAPSDSEEEKPLFDFEEDIKDVKREELGDPDSDSEMREKVFLPANGWNHIKCKEVRQRKINEEKTKKTQLKIHLRNLQQKEEKLTGLKRLKKEPRTIENTRELDVTMIDVPDEELLKEEAQDAYSTYYAQSYEPFVMITTSFKCGQKTRTLAQELCRIIPLAQYTTRDKVSIETIVKAACEENFTDIIVFNDNRNTPNAMTVIHLPSGPTARFEITSYMPSSKFKTDLKGLNPVRPEVLLNNFQTRLGRLVSRMLGALFHFDPEFLGRRTATFHNQRDFVFFRYHQYEFKSGKKVHLHELGPRFTFRLQWLQLGAFEGDYEFMKKGRDMEFLNRKRFFL